MICDEAHTALGEKTSAAIRSFPEPIYIGMTATEQLIAKQVSDVFPASVDDLPLADAARRGLIAPLRCLRVPPAAAINSVPIVGGDFEERALAAALDHQALNQAAASLYRERFDTTPGIVYAAGVDHAYNLAQEFRAAGLKAEAVSGRTPPVQARRDARGLRARRDQRADQRDAARRGLELAARDRLHAPRADRVEARLPAADRPDHAHASAQGGRASSSTSRPSAATHNERVVSLHSLLDADFYREGARVTPAPRRRVQRRARRRLSPATWLVPVTPDVSRRLAVIQREWQRIDPMYMDEDEQRYWATIAGRQLRFDQRAEFAKKFAEGRASKAALETFLSVCSAENPNRRLRMTALQDRVSMTVERADFDDLVTLVSQAPPWDKDRAAGREDPAPRDRRRQGERSRSDSPALDVEARQGDAEGPGSPRQHRVPGGEAPARSGRELARPPARGERREADPGREGAAARGRRRAARLLRGLHAAREQRARPGARASSATIREIANALADNLPAPKAPSRKSRRRKRRKKVGGAAAAAAADEPKQRPGAESRGEQRRRAGRSGSGEAEAATPAPAQACSSVRRWLGAVERRRGRTDRALLGEGPTCCAARDRVRRRDRDRALAVRPAGAADRARGRGDRRAGPWRSSPGSSSASPSSRSSRPGCSTRSACRRTCSGTSRSRCSSWSRSPCSCRRLGELSRGRCGSDAARPGRPRRRLLPRREPRARLRPVRRPGARAVTAIAAQAATSGSTDVVAHARVRLGAALPMLAIAIRGQRAAQGVRASAPSGSAALGGRARRGRGDRDRARRRPGASDRDPGLHRSLQERVERSTGRAARARRAHRRPRAKATGNGDERARGLRSRAGVPRARRAGSTPSR